jgi:hypothetical protein
MVRGYGVNGRRLHVYPDDVFLVGYPKSGNTWLDFLVACLCADHPEDVNFKSIETYVADIYFNNAKALHALTRPRFLKSHEPFDPRYSKVVCILRDPRAVAVSYFHHLVGIKQIADYLPLNHYIPGFIQGKLDSFGTWEVHARGWLNAHKQHPDRVMIVKYEELKSETEQTLSNIASFLGIVAPIEKIQAAIKWSSPENMRMLEAEARRLRHESFANFRENSFFVRKASSIGWKQELGESLETQIVDAWGEVMRDLGYVHDDVQK